MDATEIGELYTNLYVPLFPLWGFAVVLAVTLPSAALLGYLSGRRTYAAKGYGLNPPRSLPGETTVGAMLALLGLLIAFTFGFAINWGDARTRSVTEEAAALGTAFLRADYLAEPGRTELREVILEYAKTRLVEPHAITSEVEFRAVIAQSLEAQAELWPATLAATGGNTPPPIQAFVAGGITEVLDAHTRRVTAISAPIPAVVKVMMLGAAIGALFLAGNSAALRGRPLSWRTFVFATLVGVVMFVISDIEQPQNGLILLNTDALRVAIADMEAALAAEQGSP